MEDEESSGLADYRVDKTRAWRIETSERELGRTATIYSSSKLNRVVRKGGQIRQRVHDPYAQAAGPRVVQALLSLPDARCEHPTQAR